MLQNMGSVTQRVISSITAALVLVTSLSCMCRGALFPSFSSSCEKQRDASTGMSCCVRSHEIDNDHGDEHESSPCRHDGSGDHEQSCNHCQSSLTVESSPAKNLSHLFQFSLCPLNFAADGTSLTTVVQANPHQFLSGLSPPVGPPTLLSLGCALNT